MTTVSHSSEIGARRSDRAQISGYPAASAGYDWLISILTFITLLGVFLDGWAHNTYAGEIESFLTPWHAALYGGMLLSGAALTLPYLWNATHGYSPLRALPKGYMLSLIGFLIFGVSGLLDFAWHSAFGFEVDSEALLSPAHYSLATGAVLMMSGPFRAAWIATEARKGWRLMPAMLSLLTLMSIATFFAQYANPITHAHDLVANARPDRSFHWLAETATIAYILLPAGIIMMFTLFALRRWTLPTGTLFLLLSLNAVLMFSLSIRYNGEFWIVLVGAVLGAIVAEVLYAALKPSVTNVRGLRFFAFLMPFLFYVIILGSLLMTNGLWWRIHMWLGAPLLAGTIGLAMSLLLAPPAIPSEN